jgi:anti-sigma factor RsiW
MTDAGHVDDDLQELLDGRLSPEAQARVEAHLEVCSECRRAWISLRETRDALRSITSRDVPEDIAASIRRAMDREDGHERKVVRSGSVAASRWKAVLTSLLLAGAALVLVIMYFRGRDLPTAVTDAYLQYLNGEIGLDIQDGRAEIVDAFLAQRLPFPPRVFDLGMMQYALLGGRVHTLAGRPSALFVYRNAGGRIVICQMYEGQVDELPAGAERREHNGISFRIYRRDARTVVFWEEGHVTCVLVSDIGAEDVIQLAFAKAMRRST